MAYTSKSMTSLMVPAFLISGGDGAMSVPLTLLIVFGVAKLMAEAFEWLGQPGIVGEILAGVVLGPSVLAWIGPSESLKTLADLGVLFLLFRVGMEMKPSELIRLGGAATGVAAAGVVVPFVMGWGLAAWYGSPTIEAVFVGAALVATSVGITAQVLAVRGLLKQRASQLILAAAVVDDVLGLLVLAAVSGGAAGQFDGKKIAITAGLAVGFVLAALFLGAPLMKRVGPALNRSLRAGESELAVAMVALFALSVVAEFAGVAAIVGAFLAGMMLAESASEKIRHVAHGTTELLVPFFLVSIGLQVDLREFSDTRLVWATAALIVLAVVSKIGGCGLAALPLGKKEAWRIGVGMIPRGEVGMIVAQMGLAVGALSRPAYAAVVMMAAATTMVAPPLIKQAFAGVEPAGEPEDVMRLG